MSLIPKFRKSPKIVPTEPSQPDPAKPKEKTSGKGLNKITIGILMLCLANTIFLVLSLSFYINKVSDEAATFAASESGERLGHHRGIIAKEVAVMRKTADVLKEEVDSQVTSVSNMEKELNEKIEEQRIASQELQKLDHMMAEMKKGLMETVTNRDSLTREIVRLVKQNKTLKVKLIQLGSAREILTNKMTEILETIKKDMEVARLAAKLEEPKDAGGSILRINREKNFIITDMGQEDGLETGNLLEVYHGKILVGELEVERVMDNLSIGKVMPGWLEDEVIRKGDRAVLKKEEEGASGI